MEDYVFRHKDGMCPQCVAGDRVYYIQDATDGMSGYIYCLMSLPTKRPEPTQYESLGAAVAQLKGLPQGYYDEMKERIGTLAAAAELEAAIDALAIRGTSEWSRFLVEKDGRLYAVDKNTCTVQELPRPVKESEWQPTYSECLKAAKYFLSEKYGKKERRTENADKR